jgi:uncharacterized protein YggE
MSQGTTAMTLARLSVLATVCLAALPLAAQQIEISKDNKTISVTATDEASALADTAVVSIGFNCFGKDHDSTYASATETSNAIVSAITASGLAKDAIQSQEQNLSPLNSEDFQNKSHYAEGMRFQFTQRWQVTVSADQAGQLLQLAITHGANNSGGIDWQLKSDDALQAQAAQKALHHARDIAEHMAQGLGAKLGTLLYASNQTPVVSVVGPRMYAMNGSAGFVGSAAQKSLTPLAISPTRITRSATVYAVFAIE